MCKHVHSHRLRRRCQRNMNLSNGPLSNCALWSLFTTYGTCCSCRIFLSFSFIASVALKRDSRDQDMDSVYGLMDSFVSSLEQPLCVVDPLVFEISQDDADACRTQYAHLDSDCLLFRVIFSL